jgi:hypothetical protein
MKYRDHPWASFTHDQLSMIASWLAGGGSLCCDRGIAARATVTDSIRKREILNDEAYQRWSCAHLYAVSSHGGAPLPDEYVQRKIRDILESFLSMI